MKRKLLVCILAVISAVLCAFGLAACGNLFGGSSSSNNSSGDITYTADDIKYAEEGDLIVTISGRDYYKAYSGTAITGIIYVNNYTGVILVAKTPEQVAFYTSYNKSQIFSSGGSVSYNGETYYYSSNNHFMSGKYFANTKAPIYYCTSTNLEDGAKELLAKADLSKLSMPTISTVEELKALENSNTSVALGADIDLSSESSWTPIEGFTGLLSGNGHSIKNLTLKVRSSDNVGLFGELKGIVSGLKLENVDITGSGSGNNVGAIAGKNSGTIENCEVDGTINCEYATCVGGIVGYSNTKLYNNVNNASVTAYESVGGVVGALRFTKSESFGTNTNDGNVSGKSYVGGVVGNITSYSEYGTGQRTSTIADCENNGAVSASGDYAGGIAGQATGHRYSDYHYVHIEISDCENNGEVSGKDYVGGIYGYGGNYVNSITACVNNVDIVGNNYVGGYIGYSANTSTLNMNNNNSITGKGYVGGIAGYTGNVQNCKNNGTVNSLGTILEDGINKYCLGGIAGYCTGATNCINTDDITVNLAGINVGGVAGMIYCKNAIENNTNSGTITALQSENIGGIAGAVVFNGERSVKGNNNEADVTGSSYIGGLAGNMSSYSEYGTGQRTVTIADCENNGVISASGDYAGGIAGQATGHRYSDYHYVHIEISDCENIGDVTGKNYTGGIYGYGGNYVKSVTACVNTADIVGSNYVGGYIGYSANTETLNMNNNNSITGKGYVGGIAGYTGFVQNCKNNGEIVSVGTILEDSVNKYCLGGIAGYCTGANNNTNSVDITVDLAGAYVGGIAGNIRCGSSIERNTNEGIITAAQSDNVGGIAGAVVFTGARSVKENINGADVSGKSYVGGIIGNITSYSEYGTGQRTATISDCENNGVINASGDYAGGIAGQAIGHQYSSYHYVHIEISTNTNNYSVHCNGSNYAAIVGKAGSYVNSTSSLWSSNNDYGEVGKLYN